MITETGAGLVQLMKPTYDLWDVRRFPDDPTSYVLRNQNGAILWSYEGRVWSDTKSDEPRHVKEIRFTATVLMKNVQPVDGQDGLEKELDKITGLIDGRAVDGFSFYCTGDQYVRHENGVWFYALDVTGYRDLKLRGLPV